MALAVCVYTCKRFTNVFGDKDGKSSSGGDGGPVTCHLCLDEVPGPDWRDPARHRRACFARNLPQMAGMVQRAMEEAPCDGGCGQELVLWADRGPKEVRIDSGVLQS